MRNKIARSFAYAILLVTQIATWLALTELGDGLEIAIVAFILMAIVTFVVIFIHELGHALMAWRLGARVYEIVVVFLQFEPQKRKIGLSPNIQPREIGGYVGFDFPEDRITSRKMIKIALAGPAANLLFALACVLSLVTINAVESAQKSAVAAPRIVPADQGKPPRTSKPFKLPSKEKMAEIMEAYDQKKAAEARGELLIALLTALSIISVGAALANLVPFDESDGMMILKHRPGL